jgi:hypothetical protein
MTGWAFQFACPTCGADCELTAGGTPGLTRTTSVVHCVECGAGWQLVVVATPTEARSMPAKPGGGCGTVTGYGRHYRNDERPCDLCRHAQQAAKRDARARRRG